MADRKPLLGKGVRQRQQKNDEKNDGVENGKSEDRWTPPSDDWDSSMPYGGKVYLARRKKPDPWWVFILEVLAILFAVGLAYYSYFYFDHMHYHVTRGYAHLGYADAQHLMGEKLYHGRGVDKDKHKAMEFYKLAADQGHPHASYNLAVGHLQGVRKDLLQKGEPHKLIRHAASKGVPEAKNVLNELCTHGHCEE